VWCGVVRRGVEWFEAVRSDVPTLAEWRGAVRNGVEWCGVVWSGAKRQTGCSLLFFLSSFTLKYPVTHLFDGLSGLALGR
jgi:hypothetical protein